MNDFASVLRGLDWSVPVQLLLSVLPALICITLHECAHGMTAYMLGDDTAKRAGRLSLNPIKHIDVLGLVMLVVFRFGWAKPVPVNMNNFRNPKQGMALTAAAGPAREPRHIHYRPLYLRAALYPAGEVRVGLGTCSRRST